MKKIREVKIYPHPISYSGNLIPLTKVTQKKRELSGGTPCKIPVVPFSQWN